MKRVIQLVFFSLLAVLAACSSGPLRSFSAGDELAAFDFSEARTFEEGAYSDATLRIIDGTYRVVVNQGDGEIWWGQWGDTLNDVVIDVDVEQVSERNENAFGVACRLRGVVGQETEVDPELAAIVSEDNSAADAEATVEADAEATEAADSEATEEAEPTAAADEAEAEETTDELENLPNGDGYMFLIRGDGRYAIMRARGRNLTPMINWTQTDLIHQGPGRNELRAVCMGDYFALYINGEFAGDATDTTYASGQVGLAASAYNRLGARIEFDNLVIHAANAS